MTEPLKALLLSDFNLETFAGYLENDPDTPSVKPVLAPFGQVVQTLVSGESIWSENFQLAIVWTQPHIAIRSFQLALAFETVDPDHVLAEVTDFAKLLLKAAERTGSLFVPTWEIPPAEQGYGLLEMKPTFGISNLLMRMNLQLAEVLADKSNVYLLPANKWIAVSGKGAFSPKLWYLTKSPFSGDVYKEATRDIKSALKGIQGSARKLIVLDLDDTLWGGILGDVGWENLNLGGHDPIGEAYVDFQIALKSLSNRGILLAIASKNQESVALEAIERHPAMVLKRCDFSSIRINWNDKAKNLVDVAVDLQLGLQSVVFIDDNRVERARIRDTLPDVLVPEWPQDKTLYKSALLSLRCFNQPVVSWEDARRAQLYREETGRQQLRTQIGSLDDWLQGLNIQVIVEKLSQANIARATQLFNKTNQMNLSTRRMTEAELEKWANQQGHHLWTINVSDKYGDSGLTGIVSVVHDGPIVRIQDFILSCRVMGRKVEESMVHVATQFANKIHANRVEAKFIKTAKNQPCYEFWMNSGFKVDHADTFWWDTSVAFPVPSCVGLTLK